MARALRALDGLSLGDAFGQRFFISPATVEWMIAERALPAAPWRFTDDTEMALAITEVLDRHGRIDQDALARAFGRRYAADPDRGYGGTAHRILRSIGRGLPWRGVSAAVFDGMGSMGNGGAMRVAPVGAYFADDFERVALEARRSAEVTHMHPDGQAGAIAVAIATACAFQMSDAPHGETLLETTLRFTPDGDTKRGISKALEILELSTPSAASILGAGYRVISSDTVPFALHCAARYLDNYVEAMWRTVSGLGDRDTTCAIVGGIVAMVSPPPTEWLRAREPLQLPMR